MTDAYTKINNRLRDARDGKAGWRKWPKHEPPAPKAYLVYMGSTYQFEVAYYDGSGGWYPSAGFETSITHWSELPTPPRA